MRDLLSTKFGRLSAFFLLYVTEGVPQGFTTVAVATQMRRQGLGPAEVGAFVASLYLPWAWKWAAGPVVDLVWSERLGRRRAWIVGCQLMMAATLLVAGRIEFATALHLFTAVVLVHNVFAATQDVAIDALAVATLPQAERGTANGLMFAGAYAGTAVGGAGVLYLTSAIGFNAAFYLVAGLILVVTTTVSLRVRERRTATGSATTATAADADVGTAGPTPSVLNYETPPTRQTAPPRSLREYAGTVLRSMFASRQAVAGLAFALLPTGAYGLGSALSSVLNVEFGMSDDRIATWTLVGTVLAAGGCVAGGWLSDRFGRRRMIALYVLLTVLPTLAMAQQLWHFGWVHPVDTSAASIGTSASASSAATHPAAPDALVTAYIALGLAFALFQGLIWGSRTAGYMDLCNPAVAATQFTAYMSVMNLALAYSSFWIGRAADRIGYPATLVLDAALGLVCLVPLAMMAPAKRSADAAGEPL